MSASIRLTMALPIVRCALAALLSLQSAGAIAQHATDAAPGVPAEASLPEPLTARQPRGEPSEDHLLASTLFAEGRLMFRRDRFDVALQRYQRAYRYSNGSATVLAEIIPLAFRLGRLDEAVRYAARLEDDAKLDPFVLRRLALHLTERESYKDALRLYRLASQIDAASAAQTQAARLITQFETGRLAYLIDDYPTAVQAFAEVVKVLEQPEHRPEDKAAVDALMQDVNVTYALMAEANLLGGQTEEAERLFRRAYQEQTDRSLLDFQLARVAQKRQRFDEAQRLLEAYLSSGDTDAGTAAYDLLATLLEEQGRMGELIGQLKQWHARQPENVFLAYSLGQQLLAAGQVDEAVAVFSALIKRRPLFDAYRGLAQAHLRQRDAGQLVTLLGELAARLESPEALAAFMPSVVADKTFLESVFHTARQVLLNAPQEKLSRESQRGVALAMAELAMAAEQPELADEFYEQAVKYSDDADTGVRVAWGLQRLIADDPSDAAEIFRGLVRPSLDDAQAGPFYYYLAGALALDDQYDAALDAARQAAQRAPDVPSIQLRPAWVLFLAKRWSAAYDAYQTFLQKFGNQYELPGAREAVREAKSTLSSICVYLGRATEAEEWLEQVLDEFPDHVGTMNDLGYLWADRGVHLQRALQMIDQAVQAEPDNAAYRDSYGWVLFRLGRHAEAAVQLRRAADVPMPDPVILDHLGDVLLCTEGRPAAVDAWRRALDKIDDVDPQRRQHIAEKLVEPPTDVVPPESPN
jgi:tetratricopeptide (TPR) repeat protein